MGLLVYTYLSCNITFLAEMLSQPVSAQQKPSEMQSPSMPEKGSTGIRSARAETLADNTKDPSVDLLAKCCVNYCRTNGI